jgi:biopolymer transport protein ExbB
MPFFRAPEPEGSPVLQSKARADRLSTKFSTSAGDGSGAGGRSLSQDAVRLLPGPPGARWRARIIHATGAILPPRRRKGPILLSIIQAAGWPIWPLLICSVAALALIIERFSSLRLSRVAPTRLLDEVISVTRAHLPAPDVVNKLSENSVLGTVLAAGLRAVIAEPRITESSLRASFESAGRAAVHRLERYLNTLGTIASAAPLLGLMGTVIGMIEIFGSQAPSGGNNPALLAHGISVALYNTAFGLMIAIPALMFYRYFRGLVDAYTLEMEQASDRLVPHLMRFAVPRGA